MQCYELGLKSSFTQEECAKYIYHVLLNKINIQTIYEKHETCTNYEAHITIWCVYMTFFVYMDEPEEIDYSYYKEEHAICVTNTMVLQIFPKEWKKGIEVLFTLLNHMIYDLDIDFILDDDNGRIVLAKKGDYVYTQMQEGIDMEFPFHLIDKTVIRESEEGLS